MRSFQQLPPHEAFCWTRLQGEDAFEFGQRLFSADLHCFSKQQGGFSLFLDAQGRVKSSFWCVLNSAGLDLIAPQSETQALVEQIEKYQFTEEFEVKSQGPLFSNWQPCSRTEVDRIAKLQEGTWQAQWRELQFLFTVDDQSYSVASWEEQRIKNGFPLLTKDHDGDQLVFNLGLEAYCGRDKGCYVGQEVVERVLSRGGGAATKLCLIQWEAGVQAQEPLFENKQESRDIGWITSSVVSTEEACLSFGFVKRKWASPGQSLKSGETKAQGLIQRSFPDN